MAWPARRGPVRRRGAFSIAQSRFPGGLCRHVDNGMVPTGPSRPREPRHGRPSCPRRSSRQGHRSTPHSISIVATNLGRVVLLCMLPSEGPSEAADWSRRNPALDPSPATFPAQPQPLGSAPGLVTSLSRLSACHWAPRSPPLLACIVQDDNSIAAPHSPGWPPRSLFFIRRPWVAPAVASPREGKQTTKGSGFLAWPLGKGRFSACGVI